MGPDGLDAELLPLPVVGGPENTFITMLLLVTVAGDAQVALEVITTVTVEGFVRELVVYVDHVAPKIFAPFRCH